MTFQFADVGVLNVLLSLANAQGFPNANQRNVIYHSELYLQSCFATQKDERTETRTYLAFIGVKCIVLISLIKNQFPKKIKRTFIENAI